jgi:hypothetical protein
MFIRNMLVGAMIDTAIVVSYVVMLVLLLAMLWGAVKWQRHIATCYLRMPLTSHSRRRTAALLVTGNLLMLLALPLLGWNLEHGHGWWHIPLTSRRWMPWGALIAAAGCSVLPLAGFVRIMRNTATAEEEYSPRWDGSIHRYARIIAGLGAAVLCLMLYVTDPVAFVPPATRLARMLR